MADEALNRLFDGQTIGAVHRRKWRLSLVYYDAWSLRPDAYPPVTVHAARLYQASARSGQCLSLGLLPDNDVVIERGARHFEVSPKNPSF